MVFSLETASDYVRDDRSAQFGFRCLVSGYEPAAADGVQLLEHELAFLGGMCAAALIRRSMPLPAVSGSCRQSRTQTGRYTVHGTEEPHTEGKIYRTQNRRTAHRLEDIPYTESKNRTQTGRYTYHRPHRLTWLQTAAYAKSQTSIRAGRDTELQVRLQ